MNPNMSPRSLTKEQLEKLKLDREVAASELKLWEVRRDTLIERGRHETLHLQAFCSSQGYTVAHPYLMAIKDDIEAQANLLELSAARLRGQIMVMDAIIEEAGRSVVVPGPFV